jgi:hypothetical protein
MQFNTSACQVDSGQPDRPRRWWTSLSHAATSSTGTPRDTSTAPITVPVRPGRNLAIIIEVAARNYLLKGLGYDAAKEFDRRWELLSQSHHEDE